MGPESSIKDYKSSFVTILNTSHILLALWKHIPSLLFSHLFPMLEYKHLQGTYRNLFLYRHVFKTSMHRSCTDQWHFRKVLFILSRREISILIPPKRNV